MKREHKIWGERWTLRTDSTHSNSVLHLKKGTRCSWHKHAAKWNLFVVLKGKVGIKTEFDEDVLEFGEEFLVAPGVLHEFRVYEDAVMVEEMFVAYDDADIQRENQGGELSCELR